MQQWRRSDHRFAVVEELNGTASSASCASRAALLWLKNEGTARRQALGMRGDRPILTTVVQACVDVCEEATLPQGYSA